MHPTIVSALAAQLLLTQVGAVAPSFGTSSFSKPAAVCQLFAASYPDLTFFSNETSYVHDNEDYFTSTAWLSPACILAPSTSEIMSHAVRTLTAFDVPFAIRGGGHMPIVGAANIGSSGVLLSSSKLSQLRLSEDKSTVTVGPGNRWGNVYEYLEPDGLTVVGGRLGVVGVPGFLLGGGISFFGNEHGWASANVKSVECVLADGRIVVATAENRHSDLFWALRGGGNSFAIVTAFELNTISAPVVSVGQVSWGTGVRDAFLDSVYGFAHNGVLDVKAGVTPTVNWSPLTGEDAVYSGMVFYNGNDTNPAALTNFTGGSMPTTGALTVRSMNDWANETGTGFDRVHGMNFRFHVLSILADRDAIGIIHDTYISLAKTRLANVENVFTTLAMMPISKTYITSNRGPRSGDPMGIDESKAPYIWVEESTMWSNPSDEPVVEAFLEEVNAKIEKLLQPLGVISDYLYLNDADQDQPVFEGYRKENVHKLKQIRARYDPLSIYTRLMPGGFKIADV